jgi:hypothetical protein
VNTYYRWRKEYGGMQVNQDMKVYIMDYYHK